VKVIKVSDSDVTLKTTITETRSFKTMRRN